MEWVLARTALKVTHIASRALGSTNARSATPTSSSLMNMDTAAAKAVHIPLMILSHMSAHAQTRIIEPQKAASVARTQYLPANNAARRKHKRMYS